MIGKLAAFLARIVKRPSAVANELKREGDSCLREGRFAEAERFYRQALAENPEHADAHLALGFALSEQNCLDEAEKHLQSALTIDPTNADAEFVLGKIAQARGDPLRATGHFSRALECAPRLQVAYTELFHSLLATGENWRAMQALERAIGVFPDSADLPFQLAELCFKEKKFDRTIDLLHQTILLRPDHAASHINMAGALMAIGRHSEAVTSYSRALQIEPGNDEAHFGIGLAYQKLDRHDAAVGHLEHATRLRPETALAHQTLGNSYLKLGRKLDALACYQRVLTLTPESPVAHLVAALTGATTNTAPGQYVAQLFDEYADTFDSHLVEQLDYKVPSELLTLIDACRKLSGKKLAVLDLGCGTGLFGAAIAPYADPLVGVDLAAKMLDKARARNIYRRLECADLLEMMRQEASGSYDLVASTDVFIYVGMLDAVIVEARRLLRSHGILAFSVESMDALSEREGKPDSQDYRLNETGRYAHSIEYLTRLAEGNGFTIAGTREVQTRLDRGASIIGYVTVWFAD